MGNAKAQDDDNKLIRSDFGAWKDASMMFREPINRRSALRITKALVATVSTDQTLTEEVHETKQMLLAKENYFGWKQMWTMLKQSP